MVRVLIVDDDESHREVLRTILSLEGHETHVASDGQEALSSFSSTPIDLIVTDLQMPNVHGLELISLLKECSPRPAIVAISGTGESQLEMAGAVGADATLAKPVNHSDLLAGVRKALAAAKERGAGEGA